MRINKILFILIAVFIFCSSANAQTGQQIIGVKYDSLNHDSYVEEQCLLDVYIPEGKKDFATIVWYHGGGLTGGRREIPEYLKEKGFAVVGVGYRFSPKVKVNEIIMDAAKSVKWVYEHIERYGGSKKKIILSGHSAGGYLAMMLALDKSYLDTVGVDADQLYGVVPFSGQMITHFTARKENGIGENQPVVDELAPMYWVRKTPFPITLITGDRELEMIGRYEENAYMARMLRINGLDDVKLLELDGYDHGMVYPALPLLVKEINSWEK